MKTKQEPNSINVVTLGCSKNLVDSEQLLTQLKGNNLSVHHESQDKNHDVVVINTCGFIDLAKEESINTILEYSELKKSGDISELYVMGCLSERYKDDLQIEIPNVDGYYGTTDLPKIVQRLGAKYKKELLGERMSTTASHYAYLKIAEGCNRTCAFCAIPLMRGKHRSTPIEDLVERASNLAKRGVRELILISQELTYYGLDIYKSRQLVKLLEALSALPGIEWIRLHYAYPTKFPREILDYMASDPKICNYLDMPLQHISDTVLTRMRRQISRQETMDLVSYARDTVPNLTLRTTMLVGFPGETNQEFDELYEYVRQTEFDRLGVFQYSHEEDTRAYVLEDDVPQSLKQMRANAIMELQESISESKNQKLIGTTQRVLIDSLQGKYFVGRTEGDSPEVDNEVWIDADYLRVGDFCDVKITEAQAFDLLGHPA